MEKRLSLATLDTFKDQIIHTDLLTLCRSLPDDSIDAVITDPPYPEIDRDYGRMSEDAWMEMMQEAVIQFRRALKPSGSAMIILQPNSERVGSMRLWLWKFIIWAGEYWNIVQDFYWWNYTAMPIVGTSRNIGLMRPSVKYIVWIGNRDCYRDQNSILWTPSAEILSRKIEDRALRNSPSGMTARKGRTKETVIQRGGSTPFNIIPVHNSFEHSKEYNGHGAGTPEPLMDYLIRYICPKGGVVLDPCMGSGTTAIAAQKCGRHFIGGDKELEYVEMARNRLDAADAFKPTEVAPGVKQLSLFDTVRV